MEFSLQPLQGIKLHRFPEKDWNLVKSYTKLISITRFASCVALITFYNCINCLYLLDAMKAEGDQGKEGDSRESERREGTKERE